MTQTRQNFFFIIYITVQVLLVGLRNWRGSATFTDTDYSIFSISNMWLSVTEWSSFSISRKGGWGTRSSLHDDFYGNRHGRGRYHNHEYYSMAGITEEEVGNWVVWLGSYIPATTWLPWKKMRLLYHRFKQLHSWWQRFP